MIRAGPYREAPIVDTGDTGEMSALHAEVRRRTARVRRGKWVALTLLAASSTLLILDYRLHMHQQNDAWAGSSLLTEDGEPVGFRLLKDGERRDGEPARGLVRWVYQGASRVDVRRVGMVLDVAGGVWWVPAEGAPVREGKVEPGTLQRVTQLVEQMPERKRVEVDLDPAMCRDCTDVQDKIPAVAPRRRGIASRGSGATQYFRPYASPVPEGGVSPGEGTWGTLNSAGGYLYGADADALYEWVHAVRSRVEGRWRERVRYPERSR